MFTVFPAVLDSHQIEFVPYCKLLQNRFVERFRIQMGGFRKVDKEFKQLLGSYIPKDFLISVYLMKYLYKLFFSLYIIYYLKGPSYLKCA